MKLYLKVFCIFSFSIVVFAGCRKVKDNEIDATIYVKQYKTNAPIANAKILITRGTPSSGIGSTVVDTLFTDSNGKAIYDQAVDRDYMYYAEAYKDNYFDTHNQQVSVTRGEKKFKTTIFMYAYSYVKLHVKNTNPFDQFDLIQLSSHCPSNLFFQGLNIDTTFLYCDYDYKWMAGFPQYSYSAYITKNNQAFTVPYSFITHPFDTITIDINY
jgi:hypothetical protein